MSPSKPLTKVEISFSCFRPISEKMRMLTFSWKVPSVLITVSSVSSRKPQREQIEKRRRTEKQLRTEKERQHAHQCVRALFPCGR